MNAQKIIDIFNNKFNTHLVLHKEKNSSVVKSIKLYTWKVYDVSKKDKPIISTIKASLREVTDYEEKCNIESMEEALLNSMYSFILNMDSNGNINSN